MDRLGSEPILSVNGNLMEMGMEVLCVNGP